MSHKIYIFMPAFGDMVSTTTHQTLMNLLPALFQRGIGVGHSAFSFPDIAESRQIALTTWYDTMKDVDYLMFVDADMGFAPDIVLDMMLLDEPVVGAIYPQRKLPVSWAGSGRPGPVTERRGNFMQVDGFGMGCALIRRDAVTTMVEKMPELIDTRMDRHPSGPMLAQMGIKRMIRAFEKLDIPERGILSEDLSFCARWQQCGGKVWGAVGYHLSHIGRYDYGGRYLDVIEQIQAKTGNPVALLPSAAPVPLPVPQLIAA